MHAAHHLGGKGFARLGRKLRFAHLDQFQASAQGRIQCRKLGGDTDLAGVGDAHRAR